MITMLTTSVSHKGGRFSYMLYEIAGYGRSRHCVDALMQCRDLVLMHRCIVFLPDWVITCPFLASLANEAASRSFSGFGRRSWLYMVQPSLA